MLTISLHGIRLHAPHGLYPQEHILGNDFEVDVAIVMHVNDSKAVWPFVDYTLINKVVNDVFQQPGQLLETFVQNIYNELRGIVPDAEKIKVAVRKLHPPMQGDVGSAEVCFEG